MTTQLAREVFMVVRLDDLVRTLERLDPLPELWPEYGALLFNLRNVVDTMDEVTAANPLGQPPLPVRLPASALRRAGVPEEGLTREDRAGLDAGSSSAPSAR